MAGILLNLLAANAGGQVTRAEAFLARFRKFGGPNQRLLVLKDEDTTLSGVEVAGCEVRNVRIGKGRTRALQRIIWENTVIPRLMRAERLDTYLTFSHYLPHGLGSNVSTIVGVSNLAPFSAEAWQVERNSVRLKMWLLRRSILSSSHRADRVVALSQTCQRILADRGVDPAKISVIPNGVSSCAENATRDSLPSFLNDSPYILSISHFHRYKNYGKLMEAYASLPVNLREKFRLVVVGKPYDVKYFNSIEKQVKALGIASRVSIVPGMPRIQLDVLYQTASLFVFPSLIENSPNILLEAMSYGLPVLANNIQPMPEFGGDAVFYFEDSAIDLAKQMENILSKPELAEDFGRRAKIRSSMYCWDAFTRDVLTLCLHC